MIQEAYSFSVIFFTEPYKGFQIILNKSEKIAVKGLAFVLRHFDQPHQYFIIDQFGKQEQFTHGDIHILQIERVKGTNGNVIQRASPIGVVNDVGKKTSQEKMYESIDPEAVAFSLGIESPDFNEQKANYDEQEDIQQVRSFFKIQQYPEVGTECVLGGFQVKPGSMSGMDSVCHSIENR